MTHLTQKKIKFDWNNDCERSFQELKNRLNSAPVLTLSTSGKVFVVCSDVLIRSLGCVLMQDDKVIA